MCKKSFFLGVLLLSGSVESGILDCSRWLCCSKKAVRRDKRALNTRRRTDSSVEVHDPAAVQRRKDLTDLLKNRLIVKRNYEKAWGFSIEAGCSLHNTELKLGLALSQDFYPVTWQEFNRQKTAQKIDIDRILYVFGREWIYVANIMAAIQSSPDTPAFYESKDFRTIVDLYIENENKLKGSSWADLL